MERALRMVVQLPHEATEQESIGATIRAHYIRLTFPEPGKIVLAIGPGDHTCQFWELSREQLCELVLDAMPELL
jgi:hypothetical protein